MFDLVKTMKESASKEVVAAQHGPVGCVLVYQTQECMDLVKEMFEFEGWSEPTFIKHSNISSKFYEQQQSSIVLLELTQSESMLADAQDFASHLPTHKGLIVIGQQDSIVTLRELKEMGFYYLLWPLNKFEFSDFVLNVHKDLESFSGVSEKRKAKRVAIVGSKGGIGTSFITSELSSKLSSQNIDTILVDHQYNDSNIDVLIGLKDFQSRAIDEYSVPIHELDTEGALSYLNKIRKNFRLLSLQGDLGQGDLFSYNQTLCELLNRNANFIIEDYSGSVDFQLNPHLLVENYDVVVVVFEPSVSSVRNARTLLSQLENKQVAMSKRIRVITLANHHRPENTFVINHNELEKFLEAKVDIEMAYCKRLSHLIVEGKKVHKHDRSINQTIEDLSSLINGQAAHKHHGWLNRLVAR
ncbi:chromosome partitioning protein ParA [Vibrio agarivorans]|uniref:Chromosome partitioning protein ParA n=1 Tax=Vibrio agarivorans TaxID=153622 RepID=A0ABT7XX94_9VIBR|nr:chromosome partitioning protein ParA [Vibrio agarivorans]MDN2480401.1 chromosome partitioning protein ParA [Vibrio agarivorans]